MRTRKQLRIKEVVTAKLPVHWASFLINGDETAIDDGEEVIIETVLENVRAWHSARYLWPVDVSDHTEFIYHPEHGVPYGGTFAEYTFHVMEEVNG